MSDYRLDVEVNQDNALRNLEQLANRLNQVNAAGDRTSASISRTGNAGNSAARGLSLLSQTGSNAGVGMDRLTKSSNDFNASLNMLTKSVLSYELASRAISASDAYLNMQNRLKLVTDSQEELKVALNDTFEISQMTGSIWSTNVQIYQRFMDVSDKVGKSQKEIGDITETVAKTVAMSGATAESANAAMIQFSQGIASGVLRGEEFNSVAEQTPALLDAIARGLGKDRSELRAMAKQGQLTTQVVIGALEKSAESTDALFSKMTLGISATFNKLRNETTKWVGEMNDASGASSVLVNVMNLLAENLDGAIFIAGTAALASLTKTVLTNTMETIQNAQAREVSRVATITEMQAIVASTSANAQNAASKLAAARAAVVEAEANVASATSTTSLLMAKSVLTLREQQLVAATAANTAATAAETAATNTLATATARLNVIKQGALGLFGGGAGLIAMGVSAAAMYFLLSKETDKSAEAALQHSKYVDLDREAIEKLNSAQKANAIDELTNSLKVQNEELKTAQDQYAALVNQVANTVRESGNTAGLQDVLKILTDVRTGVISFEQATDQLNKKNLITTEQRAQLLEGEKRYQDVYTRANEAATALQNFGVKSELAGSKANNASLQHKLLNDAVNGTADAYEAASAAVDKFNDKMIKSIKQNAYIAQRSKTTNLDQAKGEAAYYVETGKIPDKQTQDTIAAEIAGKKAVDALEDSIKQKERDRKKALADQAQQEKQNARDATKQWEDRHKEYLDFIADARSESEKLADEWVIFMSRWTEFGGGDTDAMDKVTAKFREKLAEATVDLNNYMSQYEKYWNTEADEVNDYYQQQEYLLRHSTRVTKEERQSMADDLRKAWENEINLIQVKWDIERLESKKAYMDEKQYLKELTDLKLAQINLSPNFSQDQKNIRSNATISDYSTQYQAIDTKAFNNYSEVVNTMGGTSAQEQLMKALDEKRAAVQEAYRQEVIDKETQNSVLAQLDQDYFYTSATMQAGVWTTALDGWGTFFKNVQGETSTAYRAIFAMQKGFSIATAAVNIHKAISDGWATGATIYDKMAAVATIVTQTGTILSDISSITMGFKKGGYTGSIGKDKIAGVVHGNEFVMPAEQTSQYRGQLESMRNGTFQDNSSVNSSGSGNTYNFNNYFTLSGESQQTEADADMFGNALNAAMKKFLSDQLKQGGMVNAFVKGQLNGNV